MDYIAQWDYSSSYGGPYKKGELVQIDEELAAQINADSPGVLVLESETKKAAKPKEREVKAASNRQQKKSQSRAAK